MFRLVKSETKPLTREIAEEFRAMMPFPTERGFDQARTKMLREKAEAGQLISFNWATAKFEDKVFRMNGQHSSAVLCELNGQFPEGLGPSGSLSGGQPRGVGPAIPAVR